MTRRLLLALGLGAAVAPAAVAVAVAALPTPTVSVDARYAAAFGGIARTDFASGFASDTGNGAATDGDRLYAVGEADGNVAIIAQTATGGYDTGFSGDGKHVLGVSADPSRDAGQAIAVLPDGRLRILVLTDTDPATGTSNNDVALLGLLRDGSPDPSFPTVIFGVGTGDDKPLRMAVDGQGRMAIVGSTKVSGKDDAFIALRNADGSPAAFGTNGAVIFDAGATLDDEAVDVAFRAGGGLAALVKVETDPADAAKRWTSALYGFTEAGGGDPGFNGGTTAIAVGTPDTTPSGLLAYGGHLYATGSTKEGADNVAYLARTAADGSGLETRTFRMRGKTNQPEDMPSSQGIDLDVSRTVPPALVVVGSSTTASGAEWAAAAFNGLDGPLASMGYGDLTVPFSSGSGALVGVSAAANGSLAAAGSLLITSPNAELSFGTTKLVIDSEKECELQMDVVKPLEVAFVGGRSATVTLRATNKGTQLCSGVMSVPAPYVLGKGKLDTGTILPGEAFTTDATLTYGGARRPDDVLAFDLATPRDADTTNNQKIVHVVFSYCDLRLSSVSSPATLPNEGSRRMLFSVRNVGTLPCRSARVAAVSGGKRTDAAERYTVAPARSVADEAQLSAPAGSKVGKRAKLVVAARSTTENEPANDSTTLTPMVVGVGDSAVRTRGARRFTGTASGGRGPLAKAQLRVRRVEVSIRRIAGKRCSWVRSSAGALAKGSCSSPRWVRASGTARWRLSLRKALPAGRYEVRSRAVIRAGFHEARFSASDGNTVTFRVG